MIHRFLAILIILNFISHATEGQELVFEQKVDSLPDSGVFGPNKRHFYHAFIGSELIIPTKISTDIRTGFPLSSGLAFGFRYKLNLGRPVALVAETGYNRLAYRLVQSEEKSFPDSVIHKRQSLRSSQLSGGMALRIRFGQKGNYLGNYLDVGIRGALVLDNRLVEKDIPEPGSGSWYEKNKKIFSGLEFMETYTYQAFLRIGLDRTALTFGYRMNRMLKESIAGDLPKLTIGLEFATVSY